MNKTNKIFIRTDASRQIGSGHVMRCLTLANVLREGGAEVEFFCRTHFGNMIELIREKEFIVNELLAPESQNSRHVKGSNMEIEYSRLLGASQGEDANQTISAFKDKKPDWVIVDHYSLGQTWEMKIRPHVRKIMLIDDLANRVHDCDLLLNQNYFLDIESRYKGLVSPTCTKLLGPQYALIRPEFAKVRKRQKLNTRKDQRVFVFFGGVDHHNFTRKAIEALSFPEFSHLNVDVVIGAQSPHRAEIERQVMKRPSINLHFQVDNIAELMIQADFALGAGGATTLERLCIGLPSIVVTIAENQVPFAKYLHQEGYIHWLGSHKDIDVQDLRNAVQKKIKKESLNFLESKKVMQIVQVDGSSKIASLLLNGISSESWRVRNANISDCELYWDWAKDIEVRNNAFHQKPILWEDHQAWFQRKLKDSKTNLFLVESDYGPVGQVRFEGIGACKEISYSIARQFRGFNLGKNLLRIAIESLNKEVRSVIGVVKKTNISSIRIFRSLGFKEEELLKKQALLFSKNIQ